MACLALTGCVHRSLTIRTEPAGALVYVNDAFKGESPVTYDFLWYGWHRVILRKEGYERLEDRREMPAPAHLWIPFDLAMEVMPFPVRDDRTWTYTLTPATALPAPTPPSFDAAPRPASHESRGGQDGAPSAVEGPPATTEADREPR